MILYDGCIVDKADLLLFTHLAHCFTVFRQFLPERMLLYGIVRRGEDRIDINLCFREAFAQFIDPGAKVPGVLLGSRPQAEIDVIDTVTDKDIAWGKFFHGFDPVVNCQNRISGIRQDPVRIQKAVDIETDDPGVSQKNVIFKAGPDFIPGQFFVVGIPFYCIGFFSFFPAEKQPWLRRPGPASPRLSSHRDISDTVSPVPVQ